MQEMRIIKITLFISNIMQMQDNSRVSLSDSPILHFEGSFNPNNFSSQLEGHSSLQNQNQAQNLGESIDKNQIQDNQNQGLIIFKNIKPEVKKKIENPCPWISERTKKIQNPMIRMHNEMIDYYLKYEQKEEVHKQNLNIFIQLQGHFFRHFSTCEIMAPFLMSKVYLTGSEIQIFVVLQSSPTQEDLSKIRKCLQDGKLQNIKYFSQTPSTSAKFKEQIQQFTCHKNEKSFLIKVISIEWFEYLKMIQDLLENGLEAKYIYMVLQTMIKQRGFQNSIRPYLTMGLIAVFFHERRRQKARSLTQNMIKFIQYYGVGPFQERKIIFTGKNEFQIKQQGQITPFSFWVSQKIQISTSMLKEFFNILKNRYRLISNHNFVNDESILSILVNPCLEEFHF